MIASVRDLSQQARPLEVRIYDFSVPSFQQASLVDLSPGDLYAMLDESLIGNLGVF